MLVTVRKKSFLKIAEIYFANEYLEKSPDADIVVYLQASKYRRGCREFHTLLIDLDKEEKDIFDEFGKNNRDKIKRVESQVQFLINSTPSDEEIKDFKDFYNPFAKNKCIGKCNYKKLKVLRDNNALVISGVYDNEKQPLACHAYVTDNKRARLLYSASHFRLYSQNEFRNFIGRANRYLHWQDIKYFRCKGYSTYDFGGLSLSTNNPAKKNIDEFKMSFGGRVVTEYNLYRPKSILGKLAFMFRDY